MLCLVAIAFLAAGGWALWKDRVDRDSADFVSFGSSHLRTEQYAIVGDLRGDGPRWFYGSGVLGDTRVRATSESDEELFIGIARKSDVLDYLQGAGYATVESFEVSADTTHDGDAPSGPPSRESIWAASTEGTGEQVLRWRPRSGDWSIVFMNADGAANVDVRGNASAELPILPWVAAGLLVIGVAIGAGGGWMLVREIRRVDPAVGAASPDTFGPPPLRERDRVGR